MDGPAPLLPEGRQASAWPNLTANARALFLNGVMVMHPELELTGTVDYESAREPLLLDTVAGQFISLAGGPVDIGQGLIVNVTEGTLAGQPVLFWVAILGIVGILLTLRR